MPLTRQQIKDIKERSSLDRLDRGNAVYTYIGKSDEIAYVLHSHRPGRSFWIRYEEEENEVIEKYTVVLGEVEVEHKNQKFILQAGETLDASQYEELITVYSELGAEILVETTESVFESTFTDIEMIQKEAEEIGKIDGYTYQHCSRIKEYSIELWKKLDQPIDRATMLIWGAYFHDIGKLSVPLEILNKAGTLTPKEWALMKAHTTNGAKMMRNHEIAWLREAAFIVEQHHERYDGQGYPFGLKEEEVSLEAYIIAVVDSFDAMTTNRPYRDALTVDQAIEEIIKGRGSQFHPQVVDAFLQLLHDQQFKWR